MRTSRLQPGAAELSAMLCAGVVTAQFVAGKATRDALYLANLDVTSLPAMVIATSVFSILFVSITSKSLRRVPPGTFVPVAFAGSAALLLLEWGLVAASPIVAAPVVYIQISGIGPVLGSGFWLIATERFDPRTAKRRFGQIAGMGTLGGLVGGLAAERVGAVFSAEMMLPVLAGLNLVCAWLVRRLAGSVDVTGRLSRMELTPELSPEPTRSGLRVLASAPYLRDLAALVLLGTIGAALLDYVFKAQAVAAFGRGDSLMRFFAVYYSAVSLITFVVQTSSSRVALEKLGLAAATGSPSLAVLVGGIGGLLAPGVDSALAARGGESVLRGSLFRAAYEVFYTPIPVAEKRAAKSLIDVGVDRLGETSGGVVVQLALIFAPVRPDVAILLLAVGCSVGALVATRRLNRGYMQTLERSLLNRAVELDLADVEDVTTRTIMLRTLARRRTSGGLADQLKSAGPAPTTAVSVGADPEVEDILALKSRDRQRIVNVLTHPGDLPGSLVPHVIPLLAWDPVAEAAVAALRKVADERAGELADALLNPSQPFAVRRRVARALGSCTSQRGVDSLLLGLDDLRFEVRFQCGRSLGAIHDRRPAMRIDKDRVFEAVLREVAVGRPIWEGRRLLDRLDDEEHESFVDELVKGRASQSLAHVFTLLSLVLPAEPLQIAYRGLHTDDPNFRGTALEYLEGTLPPAIRDRLWPFLEDRRPPERPSRGRQEILDDLMRSHESIMLNLDELKRRSRTGAPAE
jgi:HEAT repeat protein